MQTRIQDIRRQYGYPVRNSTDKEIDLELDVVEVDVEGDWHQNGVEGGSASGGLGHADIICYDCQPGVIYVWEVKPDSEYGHRDGVEQLDGYVASFQSLLAASGKTVENGPAIMPSPTMIPVPGKDNQTMIIRSGIGPEAGVEFYKVHEWEKTSDGVKEDYGSEAVIFGAIGLAAGGLCVATVVCGAAAIVIGPAAVAGIARSSLALAA